MDITETNASYEQSAKQFRLMKENYKKTLNSKIALNENAFKVGASLKAGKGVLKEEDVEATDAPEVPPVSPEGEIAPEATSASATIQPDPEKVLKMQQFAQSTIANAFQDLATYSPETDVLPSGILKKEIQDPQNGAFTVLVFPSEFKASDVIATAFPETTGAEMDIAATDAGTEPEVAPESQEAPPVEEIKELLDVSIGNTTESPEDKNVRLDESRDPTHSGKKDWKKMLNKILNDGVKKKLIKENVAVQAAPIQTLKTSSESEIAETDAVIKWLTAAKKQAELEGAPSEDIIDLDRSIEDRISQIAKARTKKVLSGRDNTVTAHPEEEDTIVTTPTTPETQETLGSAEDSEDAEDTETI